MRFMILATIVLLAACAHGGDGRPEYCRHPFRFENPNLDLDGDGVVLGSDFVIYQRECGKR